MAWLLSLAHDWHTGLWPPGHRPAPRSRQPEIVLLEAQQERIRTELLRIEAALLARQQQSKRRMS